MLIIIIVGALGIIALTVTGVLSILIAIIPIWLRYTILIGGILFLLMKTRNKGNLKIVKENNKTSIANKKLDLKLARINKNKPEGDTIVINENTKNNDTSQKLLEETQSQVFNK